MEIVECPKIFFKNIVFRMFGEQLGTTFTFLKRVKTMITEKSGSPKGYIIHTRIKIRP